jgi:hypothetical protein
MNWLQIRSKGDVPQGSVLGTLLFNVFINDLCNVITFFNYLLFVDDITIFEATKSLQNCSLLQMVTDSICDWCIANLMKLNVNNSRVIYFTREMNTTALQYKLCGSCINHRDTIKNLGIFLDSKCYFHRHVDYIFSSTNSLLMLYFTLVRST